MNMTKISMLLASIALTSTPTLVQAYQIAPNPNPVGNTIVISDADAENLTIFDSDGDISIDGTLTNKGTLNNNGELSDGTLINDGILNNNGLIMSGVLTNTITGTLNNNNKLIYNLISDNYGTLNNNGSLFIFEGVVLTNYGILTNNIDGSIINGNRLINNNIFDNYGTLNNAGFFDQSSSLVNNTDGILTNYGTLINSEENGFGNQGTLNNNNTLINSGHLNNEGILNNESILTNTVNDLSDFRESVISNSGTLINTGTLENGGKFINTGLLENSKTINGSGVFTQDAGETINNGSFSQASLQINGGSVSGIGSFTGDITIASGASINPGNSPGTLTFNGDFHSSGNLNFEIAGTGTGLYDVLAINGNADFTGGNVLFSFIDGFQASAGNHWDFLLADSITGWDSLTVSFNGLNAGLGTHFTFDSSGAHLTITPVPEPETYAMLLAGLGLLGFVARRRKVARTTNGH